MQNYIDSCKSIENLLNTRDIKWILVDDGSVEGIQSSSIEAIKNEIPGFSYYSLPLNKGKGFATRFGIQQVNAEYYIYTDIDFPYCDEDLVKVYENITKGNDVVIAKRNEAYYQNISKSRTWISQAFKSIVKILFRIPSTDTQAGLKGLSPKGKSVLLQTKVNRYLFDLELVKLSAKRGLKIVEVPVNLKKGVVLANVSFKILFSEFFNLLRILFI